MSRCYLSEAVVATLAAFWLPFTTYLLLLTCLFPLELKPNEADSGGGQLIFSLFAIVAIAMAYYALVRDFVVYPPKHLEVNLRNVPNKKNKRLAF